MNEPTQVDLFSGIGGFALAAKWAGFRTVAFCEINKYCQKILAKNFLSQPDAFGRNGWQDNQGQTQTERARPTISSNIFDFDGTRYRGCDLLTGGFPCQPFSVAGKRRGAADDRAIWPQMFRVISEARPTWILIENVPGIIPMELDNVLSDLEGIGYACWSFVIPACAVDARHRRDRLWIIGRNMGDAGVTGLERYGNIEISNSEGWENEGGYAWETGGGRAMADDGVAIRRRPTWTGRRIWQHGESEGDGRGNGREAHVQWISEPDVGGSIDGLPQELDGTLSNEAKTRAIEILRNVWCDDVSKTFQWNLGRFDGVSEAEVLLALLCQYEEASDGSWTEVESRANAVTILRNVWREIESARASLRRGYFKELAREYSDALRKLSCEAPSLYPQAWNDGCWEDGIVRVARKIPSRVDRLKGLGNAIVPQVAYEILRVIRKLIE